MQRAIEHFQTSREALGADIADLTEIAAYDRRLEQADDWRAYGDGRREGATS
jgi:hypothetical protein